MIKRMIYASQWEEIKSKLSFGRIRNERLNRLLVLLTRWLGIHAFAKTSSLLIIETLMPVLQRAQLGVFHAFQQYITDICHTLPVQRKSIRNAETFMATIQLCKQEIIHLDACDLCFEQRLSFGQGFDTVCARRHTLIWAKAHNQFDYEPAKLMKYDQHLKAFVVCFFGSHMVSSVPVTFCRNFEFRSITTIRSYHVQEEVLWYLVHLQQNGNSVTDSRLAVLEVVTTTSH